MSGRSSAWFIAYDIRPSKQVERRIVLESLQLAKTSGAAVDDLPFIGMGGVRYIDFLLANRLLGMRRFQSIEHDASIVQRCEFNKPFEDLKVFDGPSGDYISTVGFPEPSVVWFDYERGVSSDLRDDMVTLAGSVKPGSFVFITATAELPEALKKVNGLPRRLAQLQGDIEPFGDRLVPDDVNSKRFHATAASIPRAALVFGFSGRVDGEFFPYVRLNYKDTTWMMTVGGYFGPSAMVATLKEKLAERLPFLRPNSKDYIYTVQQYNITEAERRLFDRAAVASRGRRSERMALRKLGFSGEMMDQYAELMRFIPRYVEALL